MKERCTAEEEQEMVSTIKLSSPSKATKRKKDEEEQELSSPIKVLKRNRAEEEQEMVSAGKFSSPIKNSDTFSEKETSSVDSGEDDESYRSTSNPEEEQEKASTGGLSSPSRATQRNRAEEEQEMFSAGKFPIKNSDASSEDGGEDDESHQSTSDPAEEQSSMEEMKADTVTEWKSKNGAVTWSSTNDRSLRYTPAKTSMHPGPTRYATGRIDSILSSFELLMTDTIIQLVVENTNIQGKRMAKEWKDVDAQEMRAFIGLLLLAGVYRSQGENTMSLWNQETGRGIFRATTARKRFHHIGNMIRFDDKLTRPARRAGRSDKLASIRTLWDMWENRLGKLFNPGEDVCVGEQLLAYRGRCPFKQHIPSKPSRYGIKIWVACDAATSYAWRMQVFTGRGSDAPREVNQGQRVVLDMTKGLQGRTITCDNFFTSYSLGTELLKRKNALVGTMRRSKPEVPPEFLQAKRRKPLSSRFAFTQNHTLVSYVPHRGSNVLLLSTKHPEAAVSTERHRKPQIVLDYNRCRGGVHTLGQLVDTYSCRRKTCRWPLLLFVNIIDVSAFNAYVLWTAIDASWQRSSKWKRRKFLEELSKSLVAPLLRQERLDEVPGVPGVQEPHLQRKHQERTKNCHHLQQMQQTDLQGTQ